MAHSLALLFSLLFLAACGAGAGTSIQLAATSTITTAPDMEVDNDLPSDDSARHDHGQYWYASWSKGQQNGLLAG